MRPVRAIAAALGAIAVVVLSVPPASADPRKGTPGYCPDATGVTVIIDFQELGGTTIVRCAPGPQGTGLDALRNAGIVVTGTARWGLGFICRIEGRPGAASEACIDTPPASAYWSYWHAPNAGSWHYSDWGVKNRKPPAGSFEGWSFSKNKTATTSPPPRLAPVRPHKAPAGGNGGGGDGGGGGGGGGGSGKQPGTGTSRSPSASMSPSGSTSASPSAAERTPGPADTPTQAPGWTGGGDLPPVSQSSPVSDGMPMSTALGIGFVLSLLIAIALAAVLRGRRR